MVLSLLLIYKVTAGLLLAIFNNVVVFRQMLDKAFDVEGTYVERVYIDGELEVVGRSEIVFSDGELKLESYAYWPQQVRDGSLKLTRIAQITSVNEMCSVKDLDMQYVFQDTAVQNRHKSNDPCCKRGLCVPGTGILRSGSAASS